MIKHLNAYRIVWTSVCLLILSHFLMADEPPIISRFSTSNPGSGLPAPWEALTFPGIPTLTQYRLIRTDGRTVIEARSQDAASGLIHALNVNPLEFPWIFWQWRVDHALQGSDVTQKNGDDCVARIYVAFKFDGRTKNWWERLKYRTKRLFAGKELPGSAIVYAWTEGLEAGSIIDSPYARDIKLIVMRSGNQFKGQWVNERRNIIDDYRLAFGTSAPTIMGIAIMTDTDNTGSSATAFYGDIQLGRDTSGAGDR